MRLCILIMRHFLFLPGRGVVRKLVAWDLIRLALPRGDVVDVHPVELLEGTATTFNDAEVDDEDTEEETAGEDVAVGEVDLVCDEGSEESDEEVPEPVGGGGQGHTLRTVLGGEELGANRPNHGTPCHGVAFFFFFPMLVS